MQLLPASSNARDPFDDQSLRLRRGASGSMRPAGAGNARSGAGAVAARFCSAKVNVSYPSW